VTENEILSATDYTAIIVKSCSGMHDPLIINSG